jgi:hypothetical protein
MSFAGVAFAGGPFAGDMEVVFVVDVPTPNPQPGDPIFTTPPKYVISTLEVLTPGFNAAALLIGEDVPYGPTTVLWDQTDNVTVSLPDPPTVSGTYVIQRMRGYLLTPNHIYLQLVTFTASVSQNVWVMATKIVCPF